MHARADCPLKTSSRGDDNVRCVTRIWKKSKQKRGRGGEGEEAGKRFLPVCPCERQLTEP